MNLEGLNAGPGDLVLGLVQQQIPRVRTRADVTAAAERTASALREAKASMASLDLLVFPEYGLHGLRKDSWSDDALMCRIDGPEVDLLRAACAETGTWALFSVMESNDRGAPFNTALIVDAAGEIALKIRKLHPWTPKEPWEPGDLGVPVCAGPKGSVLGVLICHDGMFPEMAREACYRGANLLLRPAGYKFGLRQSWRITNEANAFCNLAFTASVCLAGDDGNGFASMGEAMVCDVDGTILVRGDASADRIVTAAIDPARSDRARREWGVENNIYQLGHRGFTAVAGGATDAPYTYMHDLAAGRYRLPWEDEVRVTDGTGEGYGPPRPPTGTVDTARAGLRSAPRPRQ
ncbi:formamidase [Mycolicibacterium vaccae]|uniref:Formamidase n=1 Tax=Mycolicibacterium vaccae ATCC 25954 TaxID=1194972 RepID=K0V5S7_MYCVA|nr:formamidase [Mycolicibacterium vaccae]ANI40926.1 formamidase [Mycolicibacterium vaccae 95051]EJZ12900.1 formamidase [Mycolicibacterium vaccae ATCC 25954]MCV7063004.1 formamidase [Mycolicibacterium vaccae]